MSPARRRLLVGLAVASAAVTILAGSSAQGGGSWNLGSRVAAGGGWVAAARAGTLTVYLRNAGGEVVASVDPAAAAAAQPLGALADDQALIAWTSPLPGGGQELVGLVRSDIAAVTVVLDGGGAATVPVDSLGGFSYLAAHGQVADVQALDATGATVGEIAIPPSGPSCGGGACRATAAAATASTGSGGRPLYGIFSSPFKIAALSGKLARRRVKVALRALRSRGKQVIVGVNSRTGVVFYGKATTLSRVDPKTLAPTGRRLRLPPGYAPQALSPGGTRLFGSSQDTSISWARPSVIDLTSLSIDAKLAARLAGDLGKATVRAAAWPVADRLLLVAQTTTTRDEVTSRMLLAIDPRSGRVVWKRSLSHKLTLLAARTVGGRLVLLLGAYGSSRHHETVIVATPGGRLRAVRLTIPTLSRKGPLATLVTTSGTAPAAYVVASGRVFSIDLQTARATPHKLRAPQNAPSQPGTVESVSGSVQSLGEKLVVGGAVFPLPNGSPRRGVYLVNPHSWKVDLVTGIASSFATSGDTLVTYGSSRSIILSLPGGVVSRPDHRVRQGLGIAIYDGNGARIHRLYGGRAFLGVTLTPHLGYAIALGPRGRGGPGSTKLSPLAVGYPRERSLLFDPATGKSIASSTIDNGAPQLIYPGETFDFD